MGNWLALLPTINQILPTLLQFLGVILNKMDAGVQARAAYEALVQAAKDDGLISVDTKDIFQAQRDKLAQEIAADQAAKAAAPIAPVTPVAKA